MGRSSRTPIDLLTEDEECFLLVEYLEAKRIKFAHIHNEMYTKYWSQKNRAKALGVRPGVPDYMMIVNGKMVFIEMKRKKKSKVSDHQKIWLEELNKINNVYGFICYGYDEAKEVIESLCK